jgi:hypothetical protein
MNSFQTLPCTACDNPIEIAHPQVNLVHCTKCSRVYRYANEKLSDAGFCTIVFEKTEPIQPGTTGMWKEQAFTVLGRCRLYLNESVLNYWTIVSSDNKLAWLAEGYGLYFIIPDITEGQDNPLVNGKLQQKKVGAKIDLAGDKNFVLEQIQTCEKCEMEGQTFFPKIKHSFSVFELSNPKGKSITAFGYDTNEFFVYHSEPVTLEKLALTGLRAPTDHSKIFACTVCDTPVNVQNYPYTQSCICGNCGTSYSLDRTEYKRNTQKFAQGDIKENPIRIGQTGNFKGLYLTVCGFSEKEERNIYKSKWREYNLYNNSNTYAILSEYEGHWIFIREAADTPVLLELNINSFEFKGRKYEKYNRYQYSLIKAAGEFPYNILDNGQTDCFEYISPPFIWICEKGNEDGIRWFFGEHISKDSIKKAFSLETALPAHRGVGAVSPTFTDQVTKRKLLAPVFFGFVFLLLLHVGINLGKQDKIILPSAQYNFDSTDVATVTGAKFELNKTTNVSFHINAPVSNSWFELNASLTNTITGEEFNIEQGVEYYYGFTDGESWSEGSTSEEAHMTGLPAGTYVLQMQGQREAGFSPIPWFSVEIRSDVPEDTNFWWAMGFVLIWPAIIYLLIDNNKRRRWQNSPFSSYDDE